MPRPWSDQPVFSGPLKDNDELLAINSTELNPALSQQRVDMVKLDARSLEAVEKTNLAVGFTIAGGNTTTKTLSVIEDCTLDQNLSSIAPDIKFIELNLDSNSATQLFLRDINSTDDKVGTFRFTETNNCLEIQAYDNTAVAGLTLKLNPDGGQVDVGDGTGMAMLTLFNVFGDMSVIGEDGKPQIAFTDQSGYANGNIGILIASGTLDGPVFQGFNFLTELPINTYVGGFGGNVGLGNTLGSPAADFPIHLHGLTVIGTFDNTALQLVLKDENSALKQLRMGYDPSNNIGWLQTIDDVTPTDFLINSLGGNVGINLAIGTPSQSPLHVNGSAFFENITVPSTPTNGGKYYSKDVLGVSRPFFLDTDDVEHDLANSGATYTGSNGVQLIGNDFQFDPGYSPSFVNLTLTGIGSNASITGPATLNLISTTQMVLTTSQLVLNPSNSVTVNSQLFINNQPLYIGSPGNELMKLDWDNANTGMYIDSLDGIGGSSRLWINPNAEVAGNGNVGIAFATTTALQSRLSVNGDIFVKNVSLPSTPTAGGKFYSRDLSGTSNPFFLDTAGVEHDLLNPSAADHWSRAGTVLSPTVSGDSVKVTSFLEISNGPGNLDTTRGISFFNSDPNYRIGFDHNASTAGWIRYNTALTTSTYGHMFSAGPLGSVANIMLIRGDGRVGIGDFNPVSMLTVGGDVMVNTGTLRVSSGTALISQDGTTAQLILRGSTDTDRKLELGIDTTNEVGFLQAYGAGPTPVELKLNPVDGNVSIGLPAGTLSPGKLYVGGDGTYVGNTPQLRLAGSSNPNKQTQVGFDTTNDYGYVVVAEQGVAFRPLILQPDPAGVVGIGGTDPITTLHVFGSTILGVETSFVNPSSLVPGDCNVTRTDDGGVSPYQLHFRVKCTDGNVRIASLLIT